MAAPQSVGNRDNIMADVVTTERAIAIDRRYLLDQYDGKDTKTYFSFQVNGAA